VQRPHSVPPNVLLPPVANEAAPLAAALQNQVADPEPR
jgi:hypothetical protein